MDNVQIHYDFFQLLTRMQYIGFPIRKIHSALAHTSKIKDFPYGMDPFRRSDDVKVFSEVVLCAVCNANGPKNLNPFTVFFDVLLLTESNADLIPKNLLCIYAQQIIGKFNESSSGF